MSHEFEGSKYRQTANLTRTEIAKLMRADIKALKLPRGFEISVRTETFSGGGAIRICVMAVPADFLLIESLSDGLYQRRTLTPAAKRLLASLKDIHSSYQYDDSDIMTDYFHCRYYGDAEYHYELLDNEQASRPSLLACSKW